MTIGTLQSGSELIKQYQNLAGSDVVSAIQSASRKTGVDFAYLLEKAGAESNFDTDVKAKTSSATGLYQFIDQTWLQMVAKHGYKHGLGHLGQHIDINDRGYARVSDKAVKREILDLRKDPEVAANMAAEFAKENQTYLERNTKGDVGSTEMYLAHFLGAGSAGKFINAMDKSDGQSAAKLFPAAAKANKPVFYNKDGSERSLEQVYAFFDKKFSKGVASSPTPSQENKIAGNAAIQGNYDFASDGIQKEDALRLYNTFVGNTFSSIQGLYDVQTDMDVKVLSDMLSSLTHQDAVRAYEHANYGRII